MPKFTPIPMSVARTTRSETAASTWFSERVLARGFPSVSAFAREHSIPVPTASSWASGRIRPGSLEAVVRLASLLDTSVEDAVAGMWGERVGDPCTCTKNCGGTKVLPTRESAGHLWVRRVCPACATEAIYEVKGKHAPFCVGHGNAGRRLVDRITYTCVGYTDLDGKRTHHAPACIPVKTPGRWLVRQTRQHQEARRHPEDGTAPLVKYQWGYYDDDAGTYRCGRCASASYRLGVRVQNIKQITDERIRSNKHLLRLEREYADVLFEYLKPLNPGKYERVRGARRSAAARWRMSAGRLLSSWSKPQLPNMIIRHCEGCRKLVVQDGTRAGRTGRWHRTCLNAFRKSPAGRLAKKRGGPMLAVKKPQGRPCTEDHRRDLAWAIQYRLGSSSYRDIGSRYGIDASVVRRAIDHIVAWLPEPELVPTRSRNLVSLLRDEAEAI